MRSSVTSAPLSSATMRALAEHIDAVALADLVHFGRVPDEGAALVGLGAQHGIDLLLGADVDAAHGIVHQHDRRPRRRARGRTAPSAGCRPRATGSGCRDSWCASRCVRASLRRSQLPRGRARGRRRVRSGSSVIVMFLRMLQSGRLPSTCRSPATKATLRSRRASQSPLCAMKQVDQRARLAVAAETGEADDFARDRRRNRGRRAAAARALLQHWRKACSVARRSDGVAGPHHAPHGRDQRARWRNRRPVRSATTLPSFITTTRSAVESISLRMWEMKTTDPPAPTKRRT